MLLAFLIDAYDEEVVAERERTVLRLHPALAPVKAAVLPLIGKNADMVAKARSLFEELRIDAQVEYDDSGAIGRRYRRQDEIGTPFAFTVDEQTLADDTVTIRDRDSLAQEGIALAQVRAHPPSTRCASRGARRKRERSLELSARGTVRGARRRERGAAGTRSATRTNAPLGLPPSGLRRRARSGAIRRST